MEEPKFSLFSTIGLIGTYAAYLLPLVLSESLTQRETLLITLFTSAIFLTVFVSNALMYLNKLSNETKMLGNHQDVLRMKIDILSDENERLQNRLDKQEQSDVE